MEEKEVCEAISFANFLEKKTGIKIIDSITTLRVVTTEGGETMEMAVKMPLRECYFYKWLKNSPKKKGRIGVSVVYAHPETLRVKNPLKEWGDCKSPEEFTDFWKKIKEKIGEFVQGVGEE